MRLALVGLALAGLGCGVQTLELAPETAELIVAGDVSAAALARFQREPLGKPEPRLRLSEPADGAAIPANLAPLTFRFEADKKPMDAMKPEPMDAMKPEPMGAMKPDGAVQAYELTLRAGSMLLRVYTREARAVVPVARWRALLEAQRGAEIELTLRALEGKDHVITSRPVSLAILAPIPAGRLTYFSDTRGGPVAARVEDSSTEDLTDAHYPALLPWESAHDDQQLIALAQDGVLQVARAEDPVALPWAAGLYLDYPDWAPDASALVFAAALLEAAPGPMKPAEPMPPTPGAVLPGAARSALLRARWLDARTLESPELLVVSDKADELIKAASHSPDGRHVVFERSKGRDGMGVLSIVASEGGTLSALGAGPAWKGDGTVPSWLPGGAEGESWIAFSQPRAPAGDKLEPEQLQLWLVGVHETADGALEAHAPFWLPQQRADESNRRLLWLPE